MTSVPLNIRFSQRLYVVENAIVDAVNDGVGPEAPVLSWPHLILISGGAFETSATVGEADQNKVGALGLEIVILQMSDVYVFVGRSFFH